ncbi:Glutamate N-acetyltransferase / Amino-acid acetyltransferase [Desulfarculales bacterium]
MNNLPPLGDALLKQAPAIDDPTVPGFLGAAVACGLRKDGREDLALIAGEQELQAAGIFTSNKLPAAPVQVARRHLAQGRVRGILANSGGANAATGDPGIEACLRCCQEAGRLLACDPHQVLPCSTGVIGQLLDDTKMRTALPGLVAGLKPQGITAAAGAIMTTDTFRKMAMCRVEIAGRPVRLLGLAKGAGMIRPDMATMLAFVLTDATASPAALGQILKPAADDSFNRVSVDGDTSTNDTLLLLANGRAGHPELGPGDSGLAELGAAVTRVCQELAAMLVADGEGASHLIRVVVQGAPDAAQARAYCYAIAHSPLCKTAFAGQNPNWGRLVSTTGAEAGRQDWPYDPTRVNLWIGSAHICQDGLYGGQEAEVQTAAVMKQNRYQIILDLGLGKHGYWLLTSDLGHEYVNINTNYYS